MSESLRWSSINVPQPHATMHALVKCNLTHRLEQIQLPPLTFERMNENTFGAHMHALISAYHKHAYRLDVQPLPSPNVCVCLCLTQMAAQMGWFTFM